MKHPLDNFVVGLELEFALVLPKKEVLDFFDIDVQDYDEEVSESLKEVSDLTAMYEEYVEPSLKKHFKGIASIDFEPAELPKYRINGKKFHATIDVSVSSIEEDEVHFGYELSTTPQSAKSGEKLKQRLKSILERFKEFVDSTPYIRTTGRCGLHVNMSSAVTPLDAFTVSVLSTLYDTSYLLDNNQERKEFVINAMNYLKNVIDRKIWEKDEDFLEKLILTSNRRDFESYMKSIENVLRNAERLSVNPKGENSTRYIEFRTLGGKNYHEDVEGILDHIERFAGYLNRSTKEVEKKAKKLVKKVYVEFSKHGEAKKRIIEQLNKHTNHDALVGELKKLPIPQWKQFMIEEIRKVLREGNVERVVTFYEILLFVKKLLKQMENEGKLGKVDFFSDNFISRYRGIVRKIVNQGTR